MPISGVKMLPSWDGVKRLRGESGEILKGGLHSNGTRIRHSNKV
jgi:hypothetical protein